MALALRDYQERLYEQAREIRRQGVTSFVVQSPTGSGKTVWVANLLMNCNQRGFCAWFLVHRRELIKQSIATLDEAGLPAGVVAAGFPPNANLKTQVCSVQSLARRQFQLPKPDLIVFDECHHIASNTWAAIYASHPEAVKIGLTATPQRLDGTGLSKWFERMICGPSTAELIRLGWLAPYRLFAPGRPDMSTVATVAGDFNKKQVDDVMSHSTVIGDAVSHYKKYVDGRRAIVFMWSVAASIDMAQKFNDAGIPAAHIDGGTDERTRDRTIKLFREGAIRILTNVDIVSEGFDLPACDAGFFLRPTKSLTLWLQQIGRTLRPAPGKTAYLFDHAGNTRRLGLPDDEREWTLEGLRKKAKKKDDKEKVRVCPECNETYPLHIRQCRCGYVFIVPRVMDHDEEAELAEINADEIRRQRAWDQSQADSLEKLVAFAVSKGYKHPHAWARHVLRARREKEEQRQQKHRAAAPIPKDVAERWLF